MQVTGTGGVQQNGPRHIAVVFLAHFLLLLPAHQVGVEEKVVENTVEYLRVGIADQPHHQLIHIRGGVVDDVANRIPLLREAVWPLTGKFVNSLHQFWQVLFGVLFKIVDRAVKREFL
ncbi:hypothetical protein SDC9_198708 [bioreactor metagenome]|uniref:Uncharacterized protein n=1 Tax=bioreactor metagenome TaxID=1076179 RepID=A0A645IIE0_9ZZZZ